MQFRDVALYSADITVTVLPNRMNRIAQLNASQTVASWPHGYVLPMYENYYTIVKDINPHHLLAPPHEAFEVFEGAKTGKGLTMQWLKTHNLNKFALREWDRTSIASITYPVFVKKIVGFYGTDIHIVHDSTELKRALNAVHQKSLIQEAVVGREEWGIYFIAVRGRLVDSRCAKYTFENELFVRKAADPVNGLKSRQVMDCSMCPLHPNDLQSIVSAANYHGFGGMGVKARPSGGGVVVIELNTRIGGSHLFEARGQSVASMLRKADGILTGSKQV